MDALAVLHNLVSLCLCSLRWRDVEALLASLPNLGDHSLWQRNVCIVEVPDDEAGDAFNVPGSSSEAQTPSEPQNSCYGRVSRHGYMKVRMHTCMMTATERMDAPPGLQMSQDKFGRARAVPATKGLQGMRATPATKGL